MALLRQLREMVVERGVKAVPPWATNDLSKDSNKLGIVQFLGKALAQLSAGRAVDADDRSPRSSRAACTSSRTW